MAITKNKIINTVEDVEKRELLPIFLRQYKLLQLLTEKACNLVKKLKVELAFDHDIPIIGTYTIRNLK